MSDERALFAAICAHPEEDTPRLAYADWLDEHGGPDQHAQAAFVRTQIERYRMPPDDADADAVERRLALEDREWQLRRDPDHNGWRPWAHLPGISESFRFLAGRSDGFVRGFRGFAFGAPDALVTAGARLFDVHPVHGLFADAEDHPLTRTGAEAFFAAGWLARLRRMELHVEARLLERLFRCKRLARLESLKVRFRAWDLPDAPESEAAGTLGALRSISLQLEGSVSDPRRAIAYVARLLPRDTLTEFAMNRTDGLPGGAVTELAAHDRFKNLTRLRLVVTGAGRERLEPGFEALTAAPFWPRLRSLALTHGFQDADAFALARAAPAPDLRRLELQVNGLTRDGIAALAESPVLRSLTELNLTRGGQIGDEGAVLLARSPHLTNLARLNVNDCNIGPKGVRAIAEAPWAAGLVELNLRRNAIKKAGVTAVVAPGRFPRLRRLELFNAVKTSELIRRLTDRFGDGARFDP
ncbi:MAG: TIGR02996 domain-containing protein [Planctomycetes bacterium]|nr:TIGR02996 domain-containing protein [Planctomycetota bacterium]